MVSVLYSSNYFAKLGIFLCQQFWLNMDGFNLFPRLDRLPWNKAMALYAMNTRLPGNLWCAFWPPRDLLFTTWPQGLRTKTSRGTVQIKTSLMGLTVDMQEGGYVYCEKIPGVKVHKHTRLRTQHTISGGWPQDITAARGSCHPCLCSITHPVCVLLLPMSMCLYVSLQLSVGGLFKIPACQNPHSNLLPQKEINWKPVN